jgi:hypothetical protein
MKKILMFLMATIFAGTFMTSCSPQFHKKPAPGGVTSGTTKPAEGARQ